MRKQMTLADTIAIASLALILPGAFFLLLLVLGIEPPLGPLKEILNSPRNQPDVLGTAIALYFIVVLPALTMVINLRGLRRKSAKDSQQSARLLQTVSIAAAALVILLFVTGVIVDQYPCWIGVPNCD